MLALLGAHPILHVSRIRVNITEIIKTHLSEFRKVKDDDNTQIRTNIMTDNGKYANDITFEYSNT